MDDTGLAGKIGRSHYHPVKINSTICIMAMFWLKIVHESKPAMGNGGRHTKKCTECVELDAVQLP